MNKYSDPRYNTNRLLEMIDEGLIDVKSLAEDLLSNFLSDDEVAEFAHSRGYFEDEYEDEEVEEAVEYVNHDKSDFDKDENYNFFVSTIQKLAPSQGFYSRLSNDLNNMTEEQIQIIKEELPNFHNDTVDVVLYLEG